MTTWLTECFSDWCRYSISYRRRIYIYIYICIYSSHAIHESLWHEGPAIFRTSIPSFPMSFCRHLWMGWTKHPWQSLLANRRFLSSEMPQMRCAGCRWRWQRMLNSRSPRFLRKISCWQHLTTYGTIKKKQQITTNMYSSDTTALGAVEKCLLINNW